MRPLLPLMVVFMMSLSACSTSPDPRTFVGLTVDEVRTASHEADLILYDLSYPILDEKASYEAGSDDALWEVVVSCRSDITERGLPLGIIPLSGVTREIREKAQKGEYDQWLIECPVNER